MQLRHLRYLDALDQERHFGRAAAACNVTQSTLSAAIRSLEAEIGAPIIERDSRFRDFTPEGRALLGWGRRILAERDALTQRIGLARHGLAGTLRLGVIPAALPIISLLTGPFVAAHPRVSIVLLSLASLEIERGLAQFTLDAGVSYLDNEPLRNLRQVRLFTERYIFVTPAVGPFAGRRSVGWAEAARVPLCLLTPDMQNRRILDGIFRAAGETPVPRIETNSVLALFSHIREGALSSILPASFLWLFGRLPGSLALPLDPPREHQVGLLVREQEPVPPLATALEAVAGGIEIDARIALPAS